MIPDIVYPAPSGFTLAFGNLRHILDTYGQPAAEPGLRYRFREQPEVVEIHDHSGSDRPREIHFMVAGQKVAELGADYVDFLAEFAGKPVSHGDWRLRIALDNSVVPAPDDAVILGDLARRVTEAFDDADSDAPRLAMELADAVLAIVTVHDTYEDAVAAPRHRHVPAMLVTHSLAVAEQSGLLQSTPEGTARQSSSPPQEVSK